MSSPAYPPQGPPRQSYPGPRVGTVLLWIAGVLLVGLLAVIVAGSAFGLFVASHIHVRHQQHGTSQEVDIRSPFGSIHVKQNGASLEALGLPLYPGATPLPPDGDSAFDKGVDIEKGVTINGEKSHNARVHLQIAGQQIDINAAEFVVDAPAEKVSDFYQEKLQPFGIVQARHHDHGEIELKAEAGDHNQHVVVIRPREHGTHFMLVHVIVSQGGV